MNKSRFQTIFNNKFFSEKINPAINESSLIFFEVHIYMQYRLFAFCFFCMDGIKTHGKQYRHRSGHWIALSKRADSDPGLHGNHREFFDEFHLPHLFIFRQAKAFTRMAGDD
jgi:hypothetical protein